MAPLLVYEGPRTRRLMRDQEQSPVKITDYFRAARAAASAVAEPKAPAKRAARARGRRSCAPLATPVRAKTLKDMLTPIKEPLRLPPAPASPEKAVVFSDEWLEETWPAVQPEPLATSQHCEVRLVRNRSGEVRVLKKINKHYMSMFFKKRGSRLHFHSEAEVMRPLTHPGIVRLFEHFETDTWFCLVLEYVQGGTLFNRIVKHCGSMPEQEAKFLFRQLVESVRYLHERGIVHRDLKPENVLLSSASDPRAEVKLADFGISKRTEIDRDCTTFVGTHLYLAPEVWAGSQPYGKAVDLWSLGVILYMLLSGSQPFEVGQELSADIQAGRYEFDDEVWAESVSPEAKDVVQRLMTVAPERRMSLEELLRHPWLQGA